VKEVIEIVVEVGWNPRVYWLSQLPPYQQALPNFFEAVSTSITPQKNPNLVVEVGWRPRHCWADQLPSRISPGWLLPLPLACRKWSEGS